MEYPLISIIIPVYNVEKYIDECVGSVCKQSYKNVEIILVDDGAKDTSGMMCDRWAEKDSRIQVIHKENGGLSDARNTGLKAALGEYVMFVDSDDILSDKIVECLYSSIRDSKAQISICDPIHLRPDDIPKYQASNEIKVYNAEDALCEMMYQTSFLFSAWGKLYERRLFDSVSFPIGLLFEDVAIMYKLFAQCDKIVYLDAKLYGYLHRENSITTSKFTKRDCDILDICEKQVEFGRGFSQNVYCAAVTYQVVGALRVYLNAPYTVEYAEKIKYSKDIIRSNLKEVLKNKRSRLKLRISLILFRTNKNLMRGIYAHVDRWK